MSDLCNKIRWKKWYPKKSDYSKSISTQHVITLKKIILNSQKKNINLKSDITESYKRGYLKGEKEGYNKGLLEGKKIGYELGKKDILIENEKIQFSFQNQLETFFNNFKSSVNSIDSIVSNRLFKIIRTLLSPFISDNDILIKDKILISSIKKILRKELILFKKICFQINPEDQILIKNNFKNFIELYNWIFICDPKISKGECKIISEYGNFKIKTPKYWKEFFQTSKPKSKS